MGSEGGIVDGHDGIIVIIVAVVVIVRDFGKSLLLHAGHHCF